MINDRVPMSVDGSTATLDTYFLENYASVNPDRCRPVILVVPGGGYEFCSEREAEPIALRMMAAGFHAAVLTYSVTRGADGLHPQEHPRRYPTQLLELAHAVAWLRDHAAQYHLDPNRIIPCGFSAGGHLVASLGTLWHEPWLADRMGRPAGDFKPDGMILGYPVITGGRHAHRGSFAALLGPDGEGLTDSLSLEMRVTVRTVPAFIWHTFEDQLVPVENSLLFASALRRAGVRFELHIFPYGPHGLALSNDETTTVGEDAYSQPQAECWPDLAAAWVRAL